MCLVWGPTLGGESKIFVEVSFQIAKHLGALAETGWTDEKCPEMRVGAEAEGQAVCTPSRCLRLCSPLGLEHRRSPRRTGKENTGQTDNCPMFTCMYSLFYFYWPFQFG